MFNIRFVRQLIAAFVGVTLVVASVQQAHAQGVTDKLVKIGAYNALTGPIPLTGKQMSAGWNAAISAANDGGGVNGRKLELIIEDDGYEPSRAMAAARKLVERDQVLVMTGLGTPTTVVAARYLEQACSKYLAATTVVGVPSPVITNTWSRSTSLRAAAMARDGS
jgi:hypothetical protein